MREGLQIFLYSFVVLDKTVSCTAYTILQHPAFRKDLRGETVIKCRACSIEATR